MVVDERAIIVQLRWVLWTSEPEAGAHVTCRLADGYLERIRRLFEFIALRVKARGDGLFGRKVTSARGGQIFVVTKSKSSAYCRVHHFKVLHFQRFFLTS